MHHDDTHGPRLSRRRFLGAATAATAASAALPAPAAAARTPRTTIPFHGRHQAGIVQPPQRHALFAAFDATAPDRAALAGLLREWTATAAALAGNAAAPPTRRPPGARFDSALGLGIGPARLTVTLGVGPGLFDRRYGLADRRPARLRPLPAFRGDALQDHWSGGELLLQICADDRQVVAHAFRELRGRAPGLGALRWTQDGFVSPPSDGAPRNLLGFHDGTTNPRAGSRELDASVWVREGDGPAWHAGGTYLVFRRIRMRLPEWDLATGAVQDETIGRRRDSGAELPEMAADAHVRRARMTRSAMLRRGYNYDDGLRPAPPTHEHRDGGHGHGHGEDPDHDGGRHARFDSGLLFCAYVRDPQEQFVALQRTLAESDRLNAFVEHTGSAIFAVPPGCAPGGFVGEGLLR